MVNWNIDPVYTGAKCHGSNWNRSLIGTDEPCGYTRTVGTVSFGTTIRALLAPLKECFHLGTFGLAPV